MKSPYPKRIKIPRGTEITYLDTSVKVVLTEDTTAFVFPTVKRTSCVEREAPKTHAMFLDCCNEVL